MSLQLTRILCSSNLVKLTKSLIVTRCASVNAASQSVPKNTLKICLIGTSVGAVVGTGYAGYTYLTENRTRSHFVNETTKPIVLKHFPDIKPTRTVIGANDNHGLKIVLFQYQTCPFCCKVRAFLDYYGLSYDVVEVDAVLRQAIKWSSYKKVPILLVKGEDGKCYQLNDSSMIISTLASHLADSSQHIKELVAFYPNISYTDESGANKKDIMNKYFLMYQGEAPPYRNPADIVNERKWRAWSDSVLVHMISPNVYRTRDEALQAFRWFSKSGQWQKHFPAWEETLMVQLGAVAMWIIGKRLKTRHHLKDDVRESLYDACDTWTNELTARGTPFMGGHSPDLSDLAVFGTLNSIEGCDAFRDMLDNTRIGKWYSDMKVKVKSQDGARKELLQKDHH